MSAQWSLQVSAHHRQGDFRRKLVVFVCVIATMIVIGFVCTPAGVNPMITTESIAYMVGEGMAAKYSKLLKRRSPVKLQYES